MEPRHQLETRLNAEERAAMIQNYVDEAPQQCASCHGTSHLALVERAKPLPGMNSPNMSGVCSLAA